MAEARTPPRLDQAGTKRPTKVRGCPSEWTTLMKSTDSAWLPGWTSLSHPLTCRGTSARCTCATRTGTYFESARVSGIQTKNEAGVPRAIPFALKRVFCAVLAPRSFLPGRFGWFCGGCGLWRFRLPLFTDHGTRLPRDKAKAFLLSLFQFLILTFYFLLLRTRAAKLHFRSEIGIHQRQAPMRRRANLLRRNS